AMVVLLATTSIGAVFTSCAPESGTASVVAKIGQVEPRVLFTVDGYVYGGKPFTRHDEAAAIRAAVPSIEVVVEVPYLDLDGERLENTHDWRAVVSSPREPEFAALPFQHPLHIVYSSGTTGAPKAIVHSHGGILLEHLKLFRLHDDLGPNDRWFWYSSTNWVAWNFGASVLMTGASIVIFDGHPMKPDLTRLWRLVGEERVTFMGASPSFLGVCQKAGLVPRDVVDLSALRAVNAGGSPLPPEGWRWIQREVKAGIYISSGSGGTDVASSFVGGTRLLPVRAGEISCRLLGVDAQAYDDDGHPLSGERGELVIRRPMPSMPLKFWGDDGSRLRESYFERFPDVWCHGDWVSFSEHGSCAVTGRSDATLNRGGVRLGTSEFYSVLEELDGIADCMVIHLENDYSAGGELVLFVVPTEGRDLADGLEATIGDVLRSQLSPRHVPDRVVAVGAIPRTLSGKRLEVPIKRLLLDPDFVLPPDAAGAGQQLDEYRALALELRATAHV
ncbi:MAG: acetoacetyl-CoA synthase, partial [Nocardioidaceae bacterium]|nr:acetoacetyl-CoA synthase [Nocardioidaceae bacterium]